MKNSDINEVEAAARLEFDLAGQALAKGEPEHAKQYCHSIINRLASEPIVTKECGSIFVSTCLYLSDLSFFMGKGFENLVAYLNLALKTSQSIGDQRSQALIHLHLGRLFYFSQRKNKAMKSFEKGKSQVTRLGDGDILNRSAEFIGLYYYARGLFMEAAGYLETALESFEQGGNGIVNPSAPIWMGFCAAYLGQFHRAIGTLDYYYKFTLERGDRSLAATIRATLGIVLLILKKKQEASFHLSGALQEARQSTNELALYFTRGGLSYYHLTEGRCREAWDLVVQNIEAGTSAGLVRQYSSPIFLEMIYEFHKAGMPPVPGMGFQHESIRIMQEPDVHLQGVVLRLKAMEKAGKEHWVSDIEGDLKESERLLKLSGNPVQLAKTRFERIRLKLHQGDVEGARHLAQKALKTLGGYSKEFYPDDLRYLVSTKSDPGVNAESKEEFLVRFMDIIQDLMHLDEPEKLLGRAVRATNRYFGAERGGLFWFSDDKRRRKPALRAACNMTENEIFSEGFRPQLELIRQAHLKKEVVTEGLHRHMLPKYREKSILCIPFSIRGEPRGVLYHDNSYLSGCFDFLNKPQLVRLSHILSTYVEHIYSLEQKSQRHPACQVLQSNSEDARQIIAVGPAMQEMLKQADRIARANATVLILGETGVGKELLARRIHAQSLRKENPLSIVDPTVLPENLVESELFGHEKGAFTGADKQRKGRMELAHKGTLFIDEIGEIPQKLQVKLLRVLQEKQLVRVGGTRPINSDFRLITATNKDLAQEVASGRFREDLYYRINVIPVVLPPLRERREDILHLAAHFMKSYAAKYNRPGLELTSWDEDLLLSYNWPGNVRELQNVMERAVLLSSDGILALDLKTAPMDTAAVHPFSDTPTMDEIQRRYIDHVLALCKGKIGGAGGAAEVLGMKRTSLYNRMKKLGMR